MHDAQWLVHCAMRRYESYHSCADLVVVRVPIYAAPVGPNLRTNWRVGRKHMRHET